MLIIFPIAGHAATEASKTAAKSASTTTTATKTAAPKETMTPLSRAVAAGKAASKRALSSRETVTTPVAETTPTATSVAPSAESLEFQKKMANLSQDKPTKDKLIEVPVKVPSKKEALSAEPKPDEPKPVQRTTVGIIAGINAQGLAVEYSQDKDSGGKEFWIDFDRKVKEAGGLKETAGLDVGDKVSAVYNEYPNMSKRLIQVKLLKKKTKEEEEA